MPTYLPATRYGGPIYSVHGLCKALVGQGHSVEVYTTNVDGSGVSPVPLGQPVERDGVKVTYFPTSWPRRLYRAPQMAARLKCHVSEFDLVHIHSVFLWPGWAASRVAREALVPYLVSPRGMLMPELISSKSRLVKTAWLRLFDRKMLREANALHLTATVEEKGLRAIGIEPRRVLVIPNGIDLPGFSDQETVRKGHVLYLGRLDPKKGIEILLDSMVQVPGVHLLIGGDGEATYVAELRKMVERLQLGKRVVFLGHLDHAAKWQAYREAALFVLPSISENFANVVLEAMAAGCPVLVSPGVGLAETVERQQCGRVVLREPALIAAAINELLTEPAVLAQLGENAIGAANGFRWEQLIGRYVGAYQELISSSGCLQKSAKTKKA